MRGAGSDRLTQRAMATQSTATVQNATNATSASIGVALEAVQVDCASCGVSGESCRRRSLRTYSSAQAQGREECEDVESHFGFHEQVSGLSSLLERLIDDFGDDLQTKQLVMRNPRSSGELIRCGNAPLFVTLLLRFSPGVSFSPPGRHPDFHS